MAAAAASKGEGVYEAGCGQWRLPLSMVPLNTLAFESVTMTSEI